MGQCGKDDEYIGYDHCVTCATKEIARLGAVLHVLNRENVEWKRRAERAEAYVAGQDVRSDFRTAAEMRAVLDFTRKAWSEEVAANALLRAECEAWRHRYESKCPADAGTAAHTAYYTEAAKKLKEARAATDAAGVLKGGES